MSDAHRGDTAHAHEPAVDADRDAKIEHLLLVGLDHYFAAQYDQAINVWTRALFLDRSHPRARAYIERARSAVAERQRQSEELLQTGVAAFQRGEGGEARRLLRAALDGGAPPDEALALLERLDRLEMPAAAAVAAPSAQAREADTPPPKPRRSRSIAITLLIVAGALAAGGYAVQSRRDLARRSWRALQMLKSLQPQDVPQPNAGAPVVPEQSLALPRRGEMALARAQSLAATGHLSDALAVLDQVRPTDPQKVHADRLRADIQRQLLALIPAEPPAGAGSPGSLGGDLAPDREKGDRRVP
jgi:tetratricopeptide (TPR) repeat protein